MTVQALTVPVHWKWSVWPGANCTGWGFSSQP